MNLSLRTLSKTSRSFSLFCHSSTNCRQDLYISLAFAVKEKGKWCTPPSCAPICIWGDIAPKREKMAKNWHFILCIHKIWQLYFANWLNCRFLSALNPKVGEGKGAKQEKGKNRIEHFPRAYVWRAHSNSDVVFCCHKCHTQGGNRRKRRKKFCKMQKNKTRFLLARQANIEVSKHFIVKKYITMQARGWNKDVYIGCCDTCDSKKTKPLVERVRAHAWERMIIVLFTIHLLLFSSCFFPLLFGYPKTTRRFMKNKPSFCEKQAVVLRKTSRRFVKTSRRFVKNKPLVVVILT